MQDFYPLEPANQLKTEIPRMYESLCSIASNFSGAVFPTDHLYVGMKCYRTDEKKLYILEDDKTPVWKMIADLNLEYGVAYTDQDGNEIPKTYLKKAEAEDTYLKKSGAGGSYVTGVTGENATVTVKNGDGTSSSFSINRVDLATAATKLSTARKIGGVSFDGTADVNLPGVNIAGNQNTTGNAASATKLATARKIGGVSFNGTGDINLPGVNITGNQSTTGNAATATTANNAKAVNWLYFSKSGNYLMVSTDNKTWKNVYNSFGPWGNCNCDCNCAD